MTDFAPRSINLPGTVLIYQHPVEYSVRPIWHKLFTLDWKFGLFLLLFICIPRFLLVLLANASGNYSSIGAIMVISALCPFLFLTSSGRQRIGLTRPKRYSRILLAFLAGLIFSLLLYYVGWSLYANTYQNWYVYIGKSYNIPQAINPSDKSILFTIVALTGMLFSPIGEELFFRGIVHASFANSVGERKATQIDGSAFALTHLSHFGFVFIHNQWHFYFVPALIWVVSMFIVSMLFIKFKTYSSSILGAILCHSGFNLGMTYCIFYLL
jgi:membrane protease YdiL (CAAX protease family)